MKLITLSRVMNTLAVTLLLSTLGISSAQEDPITQPKLILQITVDQLRGDLPTRYYDRLGDGGFRYMCLPIQMTANGKRTSRVSVESFRTAMVMAAVVTLQRG